MAEEATSLTFPKEFLKFLEANGIDTAVYTDADNTPRYIRLKPGVEAQVEDIENCLGCQLGRVSWLPGFYSLPRSIRIANSVFYQEGKIYGVDAASGAAVIALEITHGDHILDLCTAPGAKLCMMLDYLRDSGSVTALDISRDRLSATRTMILKYGLGDRCRLFIADGTKFSLLPLRCLHDKPCKQLLDEKDRYVEWTSKVPWKLRQRLKRMKGHGGSLPVGETNLPELIFYGKDSGVVGREKKDIYHVACLGEYCTNGYDRVLVDAECTHDGSVAHIKKFDSWGWDTLHQRVLNAKRTDDLNILQLNLLRNGYRLLKVGGTLVYSTCSLTVSQNEDVVEQFLKENASASLQPINAATDWPCKTGRIQNTIRFDPLTSQTSGLFIAKIVKLPS